MDLHKIVGSMFFLLFLLDDIRIRIRISDEWIPIRIQEAQKHMDFTDSDPQHCFCKEHTPVSTVPYLPVLRIWDVYPGSDLFPSRIRTVFILDPDADFLPIPDPGSRGQKTPDSGSGFATLVSI
jgi:hypothetical protein